MARLTANIAFAGFTAPKLLWMRENEPENFARIKKIMLPKDYINYCLTGVHCCDYSDASGMLLLDALRKKPLITAGMRLGEGTGAVAAMPLLDMARAVYMDCYTFEDGGIEAYTPQGGEG